MRRSPGDASGVYCPRCGTHNSDDATTCASCGNDLTPYQGSSQDQPQQQSPYAPPPPPPVPVDPRYAQQPGFRPPTNYLPFAIIVTVIGVCCWLLPTGTGIVAIVFAAQVNTKLAVGDWAGAERSSRNAKIWCWVSVALMVLIAIAQVALVASDPEFQSEMEGL